MKTHDVQVQCTHEQGAGHLGQRLPRRLPLPLIGVVDPSHKEKARDTQGRLPKWLTLADALDAATRAGAGGRGSY